MLSNRYITTIIVSVIATIIGTIIAEHIKQKYFNKDETNT